MRSTRCTLLVPVLSVLATTSGRAEDVSDAEWQRRAAWVMAVALADDQAQKGLDRLLEYPGRLVDVADWRALRKSFQACQALREALAEAVRARNPEEYDRVRRRLTDLSSIRRGLLEPILEPMLAQAPIADPVFQLARTVALAEEYQHVRLFMTRGDDPAWHQAEEAYGNNLAAWRLAADRALAPEVSSEDLQESYRSFSESWRTWKLLRRAVMAWMLPRLAQAATDQSIQEQAFALDPPEFDKAGEANKAFIDLVSRIHRAQVALGHAAHHYRALAARPDDKIVLRIRHEHLLAIAQIAQERERLGDIRTLNRAMRFRTALGKRPFQQQYPVPPAYARALEPLVTEAMAAEQAFMERSGLWIKDGLGEALRRPMPAGLADLEKAVTHSRELLQAQLYVLKFPENANEARELSLRRACFQLYEREGAPSAEIKAMLEGYMKQNQARLQALAAPPGSTLAALLRADPPPLDPGLERQALAILDQPRWSSKALRRDPHLHVKPDTYSAFGEHLDLLIRHLGQPPGRAGEDEPMRPTIRVDDLQPMRDAVRNALEQTERVFKLVPDEEAAMRPDLRQWIQDARLRSMAAGLMARARVPGGGADAEAWTELLNAQLRAFEFGPCDWAPTSNHPQRLKARQHAGQALRFWCKAAALEASLPADTAAEVRALFHTATLERRRQAEAAQAALAQVWPHLPSDEAGARVRALHSAVAREAAIPSHASEAKDALRAAFAQFEAGIGAVRAAQDRKDDAALAAARQRLDLTLRPALVEALLTLEGRRHLAGLEARIPPERARLERIRAQAGYVPDFRADLVHGQEWYVAFLARQAQALRADPAGTDIALQGHEDRLLTRRLHKAVNDGLAWLWLRAIVDPATRSAGLADMKRWHALAETNTRREAAEYAAGLLARERTLLAELDRLPGDGHRHPDALWRTTAELRRHVHDYLDMLRQFLHSVPASERRRAGSKRKAQAAGVAGRASHDGEREDHRDPRTHEEPGAKRQKRGDGKPGPAPEGSTGHRAMEEGP